MSQGGQLGSNGRGALIVVEGLDRAGKSTQVSRLAARWQKEGLHVHATRFPDRTTTIGQSLNSYLTNTESTRPLPLAAAHLLFSANRWEAASTMQAQLAAGTTLIVDRYSFSGAVYTSAKSSIAEDSAEPEMSLDWSWASEVGLPAPDLLLFLDIDEEEAEQRGGFGNERYETTNMQRAVRHKYYRLLERLGGTSLRIQRINANLGVDSVAEEMWEALKDLCSAVKDGQMAGLHRLTPLPNTAILAGD